MAGVAPDETTQRRRRELGAKLAHLRQVAGITNPQMAKLLKVDKATITRTEQGLRAPSIPQVREWVHAAGAPESVLGELLEAAELAHTSVTPWRAWAGKGEAKQREIAEIEAAAGTIHVFASQVLPGLLASRGYARRVLELTDVVGGQDYDAMADARMARQVALLDQAKRLEFLLCETVLRWDPAPGGFLLPSLERVQAAMELPNVTIGLLPLDRPSPMVWVEAFDLYLDLADGGEPLVAAELVDQEVRSDLPETIAAYRWTYDALRSAALFGDEARALLERVAGELRGQT